MTKLRRCDECDAPRAPEDLTTLVFYSPDYELEVCAIDCR